MSLSTSSTTATPCALYSLPPRASAAVAAAPTASESASLYPLVMRDLQQLVLLLRYQLRLQWLARLLRRIRMQAPQRTYVGLLDPLDVFVLGQPGSGVEPPDHNSSSRQYCTNKTNDLATRQYTEQRSMQTRQ